jgi:cytochrome c553
MRKQSLATLIATFLSAQTLAANDARKDQQIFVQCGFCHSVEADKNGMGSESDEVGPSSPTSNNPQQNRRHNYRDRWRLRSKVGPLNAWTLLMEAAMSSLNYHQIFLPKQV